MEVSILIAKIYSLVLLLFGFGILINTQYYKKVFDEFVKSKTAIFASGIFAAVGGLLVTTYHNYWMADWPVIITVIGWVALLKGFMLIVYPKSMSYFKNLFQMPEYWKFQGIAIVFLGALLGYFGFIEPRGIC